MPAIYWGEDATAANFRSLDDAGDLVLAETADGATVLLKWDATDSEWDFGGGVDLGENDLQSGSNPAESITDSSSPKDLSFSGSADRDIHDETTVDISNSSGASATEDVTVTLYDGVDNTGTQLATETQSITLADASSTTATFITGDVALDTGDYFIEVTQSGTALTIDATTEFTKGATHTFSQTATGGFELVNQDGGVEATFDPITGEASFGRVGADSVNGGSLPGQSVGVTNRRQAAMRTLSLHDLRDTWTKVGIIETGELAQGIEGISIIHGPSVFSSPIDEWYMYWGHHDDADTWLSTAPDLEGPWTRQKAGFTLTDAGGGNHIDEGNVVLDERNGRLLMFYHRSHDDDGSGTTNQETEVAEDTTLADGVGDWTKIGTVFSTEEDDNYDGNETSYFDCVREGSGWVGVGMGRGSSNGQPVRILYRSHDGVNWRKAQAAPLWHTTHAYSDSTYDPSNPVAGGPSGVDRVGDSVYYSWGIGDSRIYGHSIENPNELLRGPASMWYYEDPDGATVAPGYIHHDKSTTYLFYRDITNDNILLAKADWRDY